MALRNQDVSRKSFIGLAILGLCTALTSVGCQSLSIPGFSDAPLPAEQEVAGTEKYQVIMTGQWGSATQFEGTINGPMTVQAALEASGAIKKYRGMDIDLIRTIEGKYQPLKMPVEYTYRDKAVRSSQDYALHANDKIIVSPKTNGVFDKLVDSVLGGGSF